MKGHLDPDTAAEFGAGLIAGHRERTITAHLATCAECASLTERLAQVSALLAASPVPAMPDSVALRLDRALADEIQKPVTTERHAELPHGKRRIPSLADVFKIRVLAPAAAGLAVLGGAAYGLTLISASSTTSGAASSGVAAGSGLGPSANHAAPAVAGTSSGAKRFANGLANGTASGGESSSSGSAINVVSSGIDYRSATLKQQASEQLAIRSTLRTAPAPAGLAACVRNVGAEDPLLLVESARYNGEPATIIVLTRSGHTEAIVAGPTCTATVSDIVASVVLSPGISTP